jgi:glycosyltransferase involved in cell wall biosynthesis
MAAADVFVLASESENFGNAAAEAAALGTPVIVTNSCGLAEIVSEVGGGSVVSSSPDQLAEALVAFRDDRATLAEAGARALLIRERTSPARVARMQEGIYEEVLARAGRIPTGHLTSAGGADE